MKKSYLQLLTFRTLAFLMLMLTIMGSAQADTFILINSNGAWNDPNSWNQNEVPYYGDHVVIPSGVGYVPQGYTAYASSIEIHSGATFHVQLGSTLYLEDPEGKPALDNEGSLAIYGTLDIFGTVNSTYQLNEAMGIVNSGDLVIDKYGIIQFEDISNTSILNNSPGHIENYGNILIEDIQGRAMDNRYLLDNKGLIDINFGNSTIYSCISNIKVFRNYYNGQINLNGGRHGMVNLNGGRTYNWGSIDIDNVGEHSIQNSAKFYNNNNGNISISNGFRGIYNTYRFYNKAEINIASSQTHGIINNNYLYNNGELNIFEATAEGIWNTPQGEIENAGELNIISISATSLQNQGNFENLKTARLYTSNRILFFSTIFHNYGILTTDYNNSIATAANFVNQGIIEDINGAFLGSTSNDQLILSPISGTLQNGVPFPNALNLADYDNVIFGKVYNDENKSKLVAEYDYKNNELIPNGSAIGLTELYFDLTIDGTNNSKMCLVKLNNPILPYVIPDHTQFQDETSHASGNGDITVFPNPTSGILNLSGEMLSDAASTIMIYNSLGQVVANYDFGKFDNVKFELPSRLANGMYTLRIIQAGKNVGAKRIKLMRE